MAAKKRVKAVVEEVKDEPEEEVKAEPEAKPEPKPETTPEITQDLETPAPSEPEAPIAQASAPEPLEPTAPEPLSEPERADDEKLEVNDDNSGEKKVNLKMIIIITLVSAIVAAVVSGGVYVYLSSVNKLKNEAPSAMESATPESSATPEPSTSPEASSSAEVKVDSYRVRVLNGSGEIGAAGDAQKVIESAGFKVTATGNANSYDFTDTVIQVKSTVSADAVSKLKDTLSKDYSVKIGDKLSDNEKYDIIVTVGSK